MDSPGALNTRAKLLEYLAVLDDKYNLWDNGDGEVNARGAVEYLIAEFGAHGSPAALYCLADTYQNIRLIRNHHIYGEDVRADLPRFDFGRAGLFDGQDSVVSLYINVKLLEPNIDEIVGELGIEPIEFADDMTLDLQDDLPKAQEQMLALLMKDMTATQIRELMAAAFRKPDDLN